MTTTNTTRILSLPVEIVLAIANHCSSSTLCAFALLNSGLTNVVTPLLYRNVKINDLDSLKQFVRTLTDHGRPHLKNLPLSLDIDLRHRDLALVLYIHTLLRESISHIPNLQNLALLVAPGILERVFRDLQCSFALTRFTCPLSSGKELLRFLNSQPTLEELAFSDAISLFTRNNLANLDSQSLPNLRSVSADVDALNILIPGRPVNMVSTGTWRLGINNFAAFARVLSLSAIQLDVVEVALNLGEVPLSLSDRDGLLPALRRYSIQPRRLTLNLIPYKYRSSQEAKIYQNIYPFILKTLGNLDLGSFSRLEIFEIVEWSGPASWVIQDRPFVQEHSVFETMKRYCPSMRVLNLFGLEIQ